MKTATHSWVVINTWRTRCGLTWDFVPELTVVLNTKPFTTPTKKICTAHSQTKTGEWPSVRVWVQKLYSTVPCKKIEPMFYLDYSANMYSRKTILLILWLKNLDIAKGSAVLRWISSKLSKKNRGSNFLQATVVWRPRDRLHIHVTTTLDLTCPIQMFICST